MQYKQKTDVFTVSQFTQTSKSIQPLTMQANGLSQTALADQDTAPRPVLAGASWGWLPALSLTGSSGVFLVALGYEAGRLAVPWADSLFWLGLLVLFLPIAGRLLSSRPARCERLALLVLLGLGLYFVKYLQYPLYFAYHDEFSHLRTAQDLAASGHLFHENPLLPISSYYPGVEIAANAVSSLTGLSLFSTGILMIGVARLVLVLSLFLFYEHLSKSARIAGIATLLYMANPQFLFFQAIFSYESLAIPLAAFVLCTLSLRCSGPYAGRMGMGLNIVAWLGIGAVVITHHITSYALVTLLMLWTTVSFFRHRRREEAPALGIAALLSLVFSLLWLVYTGDIVLGYLTPHVTSAVHQIRQILAGENATRHLFTQTNGFVEPWWERIAAVASLAFIMLLSPSGLFKVWLRYRRSSAALALAGGAFLYPFSQGLRLTNAGAEAGIRATEFLFLSMGFILAIEAADLCLPRIIKWRRYALVMAALAVILVGQATSGETPTWARLPGPYLVVADQRSIEPEGITAAQWASLYLGPNHRVGSDRINTLLMATYGQQWGYTSADNKTPGVEQVVVSPFFGATEEEELKQDGIKYLVVDLRLHKALPWVGFDFNEPASPASAYRSPLPLDALGKFDGVEHVNRLFDSGDIVLYDVGYLTGAP